MTTLEALQSQIEYKNANLLTKKLVDRGMTGAETYTTAYEKDIDLATADVCEFLLGHPDLTEGGLSVRYTPAALIALRDSLRKKHGVTTGPTITGTRIW
jgi:hypothetical protein